MKLVKEFALLLGSLVCAGSVLADGAATEGVTSVGVTAITSANKNTIVAVSYGDLDGGAVSVANLVKTKNLSDGDQLVVYNGSTYDSWVLGSGAWVSNTSTFTMNAGGGISQGTGADAGTTLQVGTGFWLIRKDWKDGDSVTFYMYGTPSSTTSCTTTSGVWTLVGNPTQSAKTITAAMTPGASNNDVIAVAEKYGFVNYIFKTKVNKWVKETDFTTEPSIDAGKGFWIKSTATLVDWTK